MKCDITYVGIYEECIHIQLTLFAKSFPFLSIMRTIEMSHYVFIVNPTNVHLYSGLIST